MLIFVTAATLVAFAANSVLCRMALGPSLIDPASFTAIRLASGVALLVPLALRRRESTEDSGSWGAAAALFVYAIAFSLAYVSLDAGVGALILFGAVQASMITIGVWRGDRPGLAEWIGMVIALAGLAYLIRPGASAPSLGGALLMAASGVGWGVYSIRGQSSPSPVAATAGNFVRTLPFAALALAIGWRSVRAEPNGVVLAVVSGAVTSGLGYVLWYVALRGLTTTRAAIVQLAVPVLASVGGVVFLSEQLTLRLTIASALVLGGVALAVLARDASGCQGSSER